MSLRTSALGLCRVMPIGALLASCAAPDGTFSLEPGEIVGVIVTEEQRPPAQPYMQPSGRSLPSAIASTTPARLSSGASLDAVSKRRSSQALSLQSAPEDQQVLLDFDGGVASFDVLRESLDGTSTLLTSLRSHVYTPEERAAIEALIAADVSAFGIRVSQVRPARGAFSTLAFNAALPIRLVAVEGGGFFVSGSFGDSDAIDHRNQNPADGAVIAAHLWEFFVQTDPSGRSFSSASGLVVNAENPLAAQLSRAIVQQSANTAAHELGHLLGLRHHDAFGPPGSGLPASATPNPRAFVPPFEGPLEANETTLHLMSTGSTGATPRVRASIDQFFSERSAVKMIVARDLSPLDEVEALGRSLAPTLLAVPNPVNEGSAAGATGAAPLAAQTLLIDASIAISGEVDEFRFSGGAREVWTIDLVSTSDPSFGTPVITDVRLLLEQPDGARELVAFNAQIFEGDDPLLLDIELPEDGTYVVQVEAPDTVFSDSDGDGFSDDPVSLEDSGLGDLRTGDYELLLYSLAP